MPDNFEERLEQAEYDQADVIYGKSYSQIHFVCYKGCIHWIGQYESTETCPYEGDTQDQWS